MIEKELCTENLKGALIAAKYGFRSVEIISDLSVGGLTPSMGVVREISKIPHLEKNVMLRNRPCGFCYTETEYRELLTELDLLLRENVDGIVFGFLTEAFKIDAARTEQVTKAIHAAGKKAVFHRAIDNTANYLESLEELIDCGIDRVLTSGQKACALDGKELLQKAFARYGKNIEFLAGAGLNSGNIKELCDFTGINYVHSSCKGTREDKTTVNFISYSVNSGHPLAYIATCEEEAARFARVF